MKPEGAIRGVDPGFACGIGEKFSGTLIFNGRQSWYTGEAIVIEIKAEVVLNLVVGGL